MRTRLLERIANLEIGNKTGASVSHETRLKRSILNYLDCLLNTRRGDTAIDRLYGMPDMSNIAGTLREGSVSKLESNIKEQIELYEKRFTQPSINRIHEATTVIALSFEIRGLINIAEIGVLMRPYVMDLTINSGGHISLREKRGF